MEKIIVNIVSESDISVQGHGVHTAYDEMATALEARDDITVIRSDFDHAIECDVIHFHTIGSGTFRKLFQKGPKKVVSAHVVPQSFIGSIILAKYWSFAAKWYMHLYYNRADKVLAVSQTVAQILEKELRVPRQKIEVFYNTVNMKKYAPSENSKRIARKALNLRDDSFIVLGNGQVQPRKRLDVFVKMAIALPDVQFIWVGGIPFKQLGADYASMQRLINDVPSNLLIAGIVPHETVIDYLHAADVFCLPAEQENHPMCVLEAAGAQLPIVLRDIPEYKDTFGNDAFLCDDDRFVDAIVRLKRSKKIYADWQTKSAHIAERFDSTAAAERYVELYRNLI
ncbi:glycosyltransferase family 4 protein [Candidatus Saccharibacteria bacterium]|nr:glycosyltransferase family 4 protein [Candidatus Saccharibacteria bacterium]MBH1972806.1 glycosyltransferase family 4 protein [Candidatus Saccharibacteria bacterium]MBH1991007.1 glycosyltransferase family 4 protein [Candidatus Saccharibacteria bacterium]